MNDRRAGFSPEPELSQYVLASLMDASPHALLVVDDRGHIANANLEFARWLERTPVDLIGRAVAEILVDLGPGALACWEQVTAGAGVDRTDREIAAQILPPAATEPREILVSAVRVGRDGKNRPATPIVTVWRDVTEERRTDRMSRAARDSLRASEGSSLQIAERLRVLFDCAQDCIFIKGRSLVYTDVNTAMGRRFGLSPAQIIGKTDLDLFGEAAAAEIAETDRRVLAGETLELDHTKPVRGVPTTFHVIKAPMRTLSGEVCGLCGIARDVTQHRRILEGLEVGEAILSAVAYGAQRFLSEPGLGRLPQLLARLGRAARVGRVYVCGHRGTDEEGHGGLEAVWESPDLAPLARGDDRRCCRPAGLERWEGLLQRGEMIRAHVSALPANERAVLDARRVHSVLVLPIQDGDAWWGLIGFEACAAPREWLPAEVAALIAAADLIGAAVRRQKASAGLAGCDAFEPLLASIAADFITVRPEQIDVRIQRALESICRYAGARRARVYAFSDDGHRVLTSHGWSADPGIAILPTAEELPPEAFRRIQEMLGRGEPLVVRRPSDWTPEIAKLLALFDRGGFRPLIEVPMFRGKVLSGALAIAGDPGQASAWSDSLLPRLQFAARVIESAIERKAVESRLHREREEFERLAVARRARILELERQRAAEDKQAATGRMATRIAHEINNPLAGIKSAFLLIKDAVPPDHPYHGYVGRIEREIDRIALIVRQMLDLHRPETESSQQFSAREAIEDVEALIANDCRETDITLVARLAPGPLEVRLPRGAFVQVLYNLLANAMEASPRGAEVRLAAGIRGTALHVKVFDRGPGIPREVSDRIFEPFFTTKTGAAGHGVGLGLSISRSLVTAMGGSLRFRSRCGRGTLFHLAVPARTRTVEVQRV